MDIVEAGQIAELLNGRNQLVKRYTANIVLEAHENYIFEKQEGTAVGCAELMKIQWYQYEISHVSVSETMDGKGIGWKLVKKAEQIAKAGGARILQCTIREGNKRSVALFERNGFALVSKFNNLVSGNNVGVWQKVLSPRVDI